MKDSEPISVNSKTGEHLAALAKELKVSRSELVRHAMEVYSLLWHEEEKGAIVLIKKGERFQKVVGI